MANTMEHLDDISRIYVARKSVQYGFVKEAGRREDVSKTRFREPMSDAEFVNAAIRKYHSALDSLMADAGLSGYERMAFLAAEAIGMNFGQSISFSCGNYLVEEENTHWIRIDKDGPMMLISDSLFRQRIDKSIETACLSDRIFDKPRFGDWIYKIVGYNLRRDQQLCLFDHVKAMKILTGEVCVTLSRNKQ